MFSKSTNMLDATNTVAVVSNGGVTKGYPTAIYCDSNGIKKGIAAVIDTNSRTGQWGLAQETVSDGETYQCAVGGKAYIASDAGSVDDVITVISATGVPTASAVSATNADYALAVKSGTNEVIIL
jgi:hypothetical protein